MTTRTVGTARGGAEAPSLPSRLYTWCSRMRDKEAVQRHSAQARGDWRPERLREDDEKAAQKAQGGGLADLGGVEVSVAFVPAKCVWVSDKWGVCPTN